MACRAVLPRASLAVEGHSEYAWFGGSGGRVRWYSHSVSDAPDAEGHDFASGFSVPKLREVPN